MQTKARRWGVGFPSITDSPRVTSQKHEPREELNLTMTDSLGGRERRPSRRAQGGQRERVEGHRKACLTHRSRLVRLFP